MSHFYGAMRGKAKIVTRLGTKTSGLLAFAQSHTVGVRLEAYHEQEKDGISIYVYQGRGNKNEKFLGNVFVENNIVVFKENKK